MACLLYTSAFHAFLQLLFFRQWTAVKAYANGKGISIIGDLPIYVSPDSAEVWSRPELFQLKEDMTPSGVAGVPPDAFSDKGQHWGNPLYDLSLIHIWPSGYNKRRPGRDGACLLSLSAGEQQAQNDAHPGREHPAQAYVLSLIHI